MAPPELAGDAPVADVIHPVEVGFLKPLGDEFRFLVLDRGDRRFGKRFHADKPLQGDTRFDQGMAAVTGTDIMFVRFGPDDKAAGLEVSDNLAAGFIAVQAGIAAAVFVDVAVIGQNIQHLQLVAQANFKVVRVMGRGHFDDAGTEVFLDIVIGDDRQDTVDQRQDGVFADEVAIALIFRMDGHTGVTKHGFRTGRGQDQVAAAVFERVAQMPEK